jgi:3',5'-cyclic AMP phosphodiesterase CpdA
VRCAAKERFGAGFALIAECGTVFEEIELSPFSVWMGAAVKEVLWTLNVASNLVIREPWRAYSKEVKFEEQGWAILVAVGCAIILTLLVGYMGSKPDISSTQVTEWSEMQDNGLWRTERRLSDTKYFETPFVCASSRVRLSVNQMTKCVGPKGQEIELLGTGNEPPALSAGLPDYYLECCQRVIAREQEAFYSVRRLKLIFDTGIFGYFPLLFFGVTVVGLAGSALYAFNGLVLNPLTIAIPSFLRGLRNTLRAITLPRLQDHRFDHSYVGRPFLAQLSDLHLTSPEAHPLELKTLPEKWPHDQLIDGKQALATTVSALDNAFRTKCSIVVVSGDITDEGGSDQWQQFVEAIKKSKLSEPRLTTEPPRLVLMAGNHDINFNRPEYPDLDLSRTKNRQECYVRTCDQISKMIPCVWATAKSPVFLEASHEFNFLALDTNTYPSHSSLSGAIGRLGRSQLSEIKKTLKNIGGPLVVALHHHLGIPKGQKRGIDDLWMTTHDSRALLRILRKYSKASPHNLVLVIHGHKHRLYTATDPSGRIKIFGLGSSTLGSESFSKEDGRFKLDGRGIFAEIGLTSNGEWAVAVKSSIDGHPSTPQSSSSYTNPLRC